MAFDGSGSIRLRPRNNLPVQQEVAQQEDKRAVQGEATQQPAHVLSHHHYNMQRCHLSRCHGITRHCYLPRRQCNMWCCLWPCRHGSRRRCLWPHHHGEMWCHHCDKAKTLYLVELIAEYFKLLKRKPFWFLNPLGY